MPLQPVIEKDILTNNIIERGEKSGSENDNDNNISKVVHGKKRSLRITVEKRQ